MACTISGQIPERERERVSFLAASGDKYSIVKSTDFPK